MDPLKDWVTKELYGEHAVHTHGRVVLMGKNHDKIEGGMSVIFGLVFPDLVADHQEHEMWQGDIILIPSRKYRGFEDSGATIQQILLGGFAEPERWDRKIFDRKDEAR